MVEYEVGSGGGGVGGGGGGGGGGDAHPVLNPADANAALHRSLHAAPTPTIVYSAVTARENPTRRIIVLRGKT
jgi:hypothetical protein